MPAEEEEAADRLGSGTVSIHRFFEYNSSKDTIMLIIGTIGAIVAGLLLPSIALIMGSIANIFGDDGISGEEMSETIAETAKLICLVSVLIFVFAYIFFAFWQHLAENISLKLRKMYLKSLLNQEIAYFEQI